MKTKEKKPLQTRMKEMKDRRGKIFGITMTDDLQEKHDALYKVTGLREPSELHRFAITNLYRQLVLKLN